MTEVQAPSDERGLRASEGLVRFMDVDAERGSRGRIARRISYPRQTPTRETPMLRGMLPLVLSVLTFAQTVGAQQTPAWTRFASTFDAAMDSDKVAGGAALLVVDGRVVAHHERGLADR